MKKIFLTLLVVLSASALYAQTTEQVIVDENKHRYITNGFWDNWFIQLGAGAQTYFGDHNKQLDFGDRITPAFEVAAGKWFSPSFGTRLMLAGFTYKGATQNGAHQVGTDYILPEHWLYKQKFEFFNLHIDFMFNLSNIISGYRQDRFWDVQPYVGVGWIHTWDEPTNHSVTYDAGILNALRLSDKFDLNIDVRAGMLNDAFESERGGRDHEGFLSATLGFTYNFKKRGWDRSKTIVRETTNTLALENLQREMDALKKANDELKNRKPVVRTQKVVAPVYVTFEIRESKLSEEARINLGLFAEAVKKLNNDVVYTISGYADAATGNDTINDRLSQERAQAVYDCLVNEFGVNKKQFTVEHHGGVNNMFYDDPRLSRATIISVK